MRTSIHVSSSYEKGFVESRTKNSNTVSNHLTSLSTAFRNNPSAFDGVKLNLVNSNINKVDDISRQLGVKVKTLYLSNNSISSLVGIEIFSSVVNASISHNLIRYLEELQPLAKLKHLEKLSLDGNVVTAVPYYRDFVISLCKGLQTLDGVKITNAERASANLGSRKLESIFQQLRLNELHSCVLSHLQNRLKCKIEMAEVVSGKFRVLRGAHIDSHQSLEKPVCVSSILAQALKGGVYRWLQTYNASMFNKAVQNLTRKAYLGLLRKMTQAQRNHINQNQAVLSNFWDDILAECISYQQTKIISLLEVCDYSLESLDNARVEHMDRKDEGGINVLQRIGFVDDTTAAYGGVSFCGIDRPHDKAEDSVSQAPEVKVKLNDRLQNQKENIKEENFHRAATQEKYAQLLRSHSKEAPTKTNSSLSSFLPPRQEEPHDKENQTSKCDVSFSNTAQTVISSTEVSAFLHRCYETPGFTLDFSWENKVSNLPEQVDIGPKPSPPSAPFAIEDPNMKAMKKIVQDAFQELTIRQRNSAMCATANNSLRKKFVDARKQLMNNIEVGRALVSKCKTTILVMQDDINKGEAWCQVCGTIIVAVERQKERVAEIDNDIKDLENGCSDAYKATKREGELKEQLIKSQREVADALRAVDFEINNDSTLQQLFRRHYITDKAMNTFINITNLGIKKRILKLWRIRIDRLLRIRQFAAMMLRKRGLVIKRGSIKIWRAFVYVNKLGGILRLVRNKATLKEQLQQWRRAFVFSRRVKSFQKRRVLLIKHRALRILFEDVRVAKMLVVRNKHSRQKLAVCLAKKFFKAIKAIYISAKPDKVKEAANIFKAMKMRKSRFFTAWKAIITNLHLKLSKAETLVASRHRKQKLSDFMSEWHNIAAAFVHHRLYRCKCYLRNWRSRKFKKLSKKKYWEVIFKITRPSMKACKKVLKRLRSMIITTRRIDGSARTLLKNTSFRSIRNVFQVWLKAYHGVRLDLYLSTTARSFYCHKLLTSIFRKWTIMLLKSKIAIETSELLALEEQEPGKSVTRYRETRPSGIFKALIYVSDDDDDMPLRSRHASHFCVIMLRLLDRWRLRAQRLVRLRAIASKLRGTNQTLYLRRCYSVMLNRYVTLVRSKVARCFEENSRKESRLISIASVNGQFQFITADSRDSSHSESLPDSLRREIKESTAKISALRNDVHSLMGQLSDTERLNYDVAVNISNAQSTYDIIKNEYSRCLNDTELLRDSSCRIMEAYQSAQNPSKEKGHILKYAVADNKDILEEKQHLTLEVEESYKKTTQLQQKSTKKKNQLASSARAAVEYSMQCKNCILEHDKRIEQLRSDRAHLDDSLAALKSALHDSINGVSANALFNEKAIQEIHREEQYLHGKLETLSKEEQALNLEMNQLQKESTLMRRQIFLKSTSDLSDVEMNARSYHLRSLGHRENLITDNINNDSKLTESILSLSSKTIDLSEAVSSVNYVVPSKKSSSANKPRDAPLGKKVPVGKQKTPKAVVKKASSKKHDDVTESGIDEFQSIAYRVRQRLDTNPN